MNGTDNGSFTDVVVGRSDAGIDGGGGGDPLTEVPGI
jgi:hypothetical protein